MSNIDVKKKIVQQASDASTVNTPALQNTPKVASSVTTPTQTPMNNTPASPGAPGGLTGTNQNLNPMMRSASVAQAPTPQVNPNGRATPPGNIIDQMKPVIDNQNKVDKDFLDKWQQVNNDRVDNEHKNAMEQLENSKLEAEKNFQSGKEELGTTLYNQQEQLNADGTNRGISNSPQILGLQGVHNINYNKNLTKLMEQKSSLLNDINLKINSLNRDYTNSKNDIALGLLDKQTSLSGKYNQQMIDLMLQQHNQDYNRWQTEDEREYNQSQTKEEREWQKEWLKYQLETEKQYEKNGKSGYSSSYSPNYSYKSNYKPYNWSNWSKGGSYGSSGVDYNNTRVANAGLDEAYKGSTDVFNELVNRNSITTLDNYDDKLGIYDSVTDEYAGALKGLDPAYQKDYETTRNIARKKMLDRAYGNSTNTPYRVYDKKLGQDVIVRPTLPYNDKKIDKNKQKGNVMKYEQKLGSTGERIAKNANEVHNRIMKKSTSKKTPDRRIAEKKEKKKVETKMEVIKKTQAKQTQAKKETKMTKAQAQGKKIAEQQRKQKALAKKREQERQARIKKTKNTISSFFKKIFG